VVQGEAAKERRPIEERSVDVNDLLLGALSKEDPQGSARLRLELAERGPRRGRGVRGEGDAVQASKKGHRAAEEVVEALAEKASRSLLGG
jgi:hypothetical protein